MTSYSEALRAAAAAVEAKEAEVRATMEVADLLPACRVLLAALDRDASKTNQLIAEAPYEHAISLLCLAVQLGTAAFGDEARLREEVAALAMDQELRLP